MSIALARAAYLRGADVTIVHGHVSVDLPYYTTNIRAMSAQDMYDTVFNIVDKFDIIISAAAVSDFTPAEVSSKKIKKTEIDPTDKKLVKPYKLELKQTEDILLKLGKIRSPHQFVIGFAAESENLIKNATEKLQKKRANMIVANLLSVVGDDDSEVTILPTQNSFSGNKFLIAHFILDNAKTLATADGGMRFPSTKTQAKDPV
jgi:phosphopantothenoylcysteine decarboxylase/phosphopantothenate--cysteine ligase